MGCLAVHLKLVVPRSTAPVKIEVAVCHALRLPAASHIQTHLVCCLRCCVVF